MQFMGAKARTKKKEGHLQALCDNTVKMLTDEDLCRFFNLFYLNKIGFRTRMRSVSTELNFDIFLRINWHNIMYICHKTDVGLLLLAL